MVRPTLVAAALCGAATTASAGFDGIYKQAADSDCALVGVDGGALKIEDDVFYGVDATCEMVDPVPVNDMDAVLYTMRCTSEKGEWSARSMILNGADGGLIMVWDGYAFKYDSCPDPDSANPVTESIPEDATVVSGEDAEETVEPAVSADPASKPAAPEGEAEELPVEDAELDTEAG
ncbi:hypothetical protein [Donghicola sp. XS_ASV15]|uniref:hypothetical protein n=1 Tax=Donghicola sp. XS_ASV15 TaxID=3241295 RepID=UPI003519786F